MDALAGGVTGLRRFLFLRNFYSNSEFADIWNKQSDRDKACKKIESPPAAQTAGGLFVFAPDDFLLLQRLPRKVVERERQGTKRQH
jgi:hypothetical protein